MRHQDRVTAAVAVTLLLAGCSGGGGGGASPETTAPFSLEIMDAPVEYSSIKSVCVPFNAVTVHYADDQEVRLDYAPLTSQISHDTHCTKRLSGTSFDPVRLSELSAGLTVHLVDSLQIPTGRVNWIRLHFVEGSYIEFFGTGGYEPLICPSCEVTDNNQGRGFKLNRTFDVPDSGLSLLVDIDLRKSLHYTNGRGYILRPTARVEPSDSQGTIAGNVLTLFVLGLGGQTYLTGAEDTGCAVYVFPDDDTPLQDFSRDGSNVIATAAVRATGNGEPLYYGFAAGALPVEPDGSDKSYRVALTCDADDPTVGNESDVEFSLPQTVLVSAGQTSQVDFF